MKKRQDTKLNFAAVPARAMGDEELSALDIRVLMVVAAHDRFGANGVGCFASHKRLSTLVRCHDKSLSRSLRTLGERGYIEGRLNPLNKKTRIYSVIYGDQDKTYMDSCRTGKGNEPATLGPTIGNEPATNGTPIGNQTRRFDQDIGNQLSEEIEQNHAVADGNISCEAENTSCKAQQIYPEKSACLENERLSDGQLLARIDRQLKEGKWTVHLLQTFVPMLEQILERAEGNSQEYGWSDRLLAKIDEELNPTVEVLDDPF